MCAFRTDQDVREATSAHAVESFSTFMRCSSASTSGKGKAQRQLECVPRSGSMTEHLIQQSVCVFHLS